MKLTTIILKNYRCYQDLTIDLHPQTTVLVANNGQGKTTILDAIRVALWPYVSQFDLSRTGYAEPANTITIDDVRIIRSSTSAGLTDEMVRLIPASVKAIGDYGDGETIWERFRDSEASKSQTKDDKTCRELKFFAKQLQQDIRNLESPPITLPVFGYYGTGRLWKEKRLTESKKGRNSNDKNIRTFAYRDCLDPASSYHQFEEWFSNAYKKVLEYQLQQVQQGAKTIEVDPILETPVKVVQDAVNEVLKPVGWKYLHFSQRDNALVLRHDEYGVIKAEQLSDGIKNILAMVADIAYRCVLLNSHLGKDAAKKSGGIIMIDEVDMHLHPRWQQTVVESLQSAFPKIQFILTTHSSQVLTTVPSQCIRIISDGEVHAAPKGSKGAESSRLLKRILGVDSRPQNDENTQLLQAYEKLVYADKWNTDEARQKREKLDDIYSGEEPKLTELDLYIENRNWELDIEENQ